MKRGLFFLDGQEWWRMRKLLNPILLKDKALSPALEFSNKITDQMITSMGRKIGTAQGEAIEIDLESDLHKWSVCSTLATLFGAAFFDLDLGVQDLDGFIQDTHEVFDMSAVLQTMSAKDACQNNTEDWQKFVQASERSWSFINRITDTIPMNTDQGGLAPQMLQAFDSREEVGRIVNDLVIAAADTSSYTLQWTLFLISKHVLEADQANLVKEQSLNCCKESMRLYPVAPFLTRIITESEVKLDENLIIPPGQLVLLSSYAMGRDSRNFERPEEFWPQRWNRNDGRGRRQGVLNSFASLPFSFGSRSCIGKKMAEHQLDYFLKQFYSRFVATVVNGDDVNMIMRLIGLPDKTIRFSIKSRS